MKLSKTDQAIKLMQETRISAYAAAKLIGVDAASISRRIKWLNDNKDRVCKECGQVRKSKS